MSEAAQPDIAAELPGATSASAEILAFPARPEDRLRRALRGLEAALAEQAIAVASLRQELGALSGALGGLEESLTGYAGALDAADQEVRRANAEARKLESTADAMLALTR